MKIIAHPALIALLLAACAPDAAPADGLASCEDPDVRNVVLRFGEELQNVPLLAGDSIVAQAVAAAYGPLVTDSLLATWIRGTSDVPGREVSSPWPDRIEIDSVATVGEGACYVHGRVIYMASTGPAGDDVVRVTVARSDDGWRIRGYELLAPTDDDPPQGDDSVPQDVPPASDADAAASVIRDYYAAIDAGRFREAYALWRDDGAASGQSYEEFAAGFTETADVTVDIGAPGRIEGAAGSRYVMLPVMVEAVTSAGDTQHFAGTYTLQRSVADGASAEQRAWRIRSAEISAH